MRINPEHWVKADGMDVLAHVVEVYVSIIATPLTDSTAVKPITYYLKQVFERKGRVVAGVATGYLCATFLGPKGPISLDKIFVGIGQSSPRPRKPEVVSKLREFESLIHETQKEKFEG